MQTPPRANPAVCPRAPGRSGFESAPTSPSGLGGVARILVFGQTPQAPGQSPLAPGQTPLEPGQSPPAPWQTPLTPGQSPLSALPAGDQGPTYAVVPIPFSLEDPLE